MSDDLKRNAFRGLIGLALVLALAGLFFRPETGPESWPLMYPILGSTAVIALVLLVRSLSLILRLPGGDRDAD